jgi:hypothetical protein
VILSMIFLLGFGTFATVCFFFFLLLNFIISKSSCIQLYSICRDLEKKCQCFYANTEKNRFDTARFIT